MNGSNLQLSHKRAREAMKKKAIRAAIVAMAVVIVGLRIACYFLAPVLCVILAWTGMWPHNLSSFIRTCFLAALGIVAVEIIGLMLLENALNIHSWLRDRYGED